MESTNFAFSRTAIPEWPDIWLKAADPEYDIVGGGITILDSRTQDASGTPHVVFTSVSRNYLYPPLENMPQVI